MNKIKIEYFSSSMKNQVLLTLICFCLYIGSVTTLQAQKIVPFKDETGKFGYKFKHSGQIVVKPQFDDAREFSGQIGRVKQGGAWGLINREGKIIANPKYKFIFKFSGAGIAKVCIGGDDYGIGSKWGFINSAGKEIIQTKYDQVEDFPIKSLMKVCIGGYYEEIGDDVAYVKLENQEEANKKKKSFENVGLGEKVSLDGQKVWAGGKWGLVNTAGRLVIPAKYDFIADRLQGKLIKVCQGCKVDYSNYYYGEWTGGKQGFIDEIGQEVVPLEFSGIYQITDKISYVSNGSKFYDRANSTWPGNGKCGLINDEGLKLTELIFDEIDHFNDGMARVLVHDGKKRLYGFIDHTGLVVIPAVLEYSEVFKYKSGFVLVANSIPGGGLHYGLLNHEGCLVVPVEYNKIALKKDQVCMWKDGKVECKPKAEVKVCKDEDGGDSDWVEDEDDDGWKN